MKEAFRKGWLSLPRTALRFSLPGLLHLTTLAPAWEFLEISWVGVGLQAPQREGIYCPVLCSPSSLLLGLAGQAGTFCRHVTASLS